MPASLFSTQLTTAELQLLRDLESFLLDHGVSQSLIEQELREELALHRAAEARAAARREREFALAGGKCPF